MVAKATGWKMNRYQYVQTSEHSSMQQSDQVAMDYLPATDIMKCPTKVVEESRQEVHWKD